MTSTRFNASLDYYYYYLEGKTLKCITNLEVVVTSGDEFIFHVTARKKNHTLVTALPS